MLRTALKYATLVLLPVVTMFALGEAAVRIFVPQTGRRPLRDADLGWSTAEYRRFKPAKELAKTRDKSRVLFLGDSYLAGAEVSRMSQRYPVYFESLTNGKAAAWIFAGGGWGPDQELLAYMQKGGAWRPNLVVLAFTPTNDLANILSNHHGPNMPKPYFTLTGGRLTCMDPAGKPVGIRPGGTGGRVLPESRLAVFLKYAIESRRERTAAATRGVDPRYTTFAPWAEKPGELRRLNRKLTWSPQNTASQVSAFIHEDFATNTYQWELMDAIVGALKTETEKSGARLMVMMTPSAFKAGDLRFVAGGTMEFKFDTPSGPFTFRASEPNDRMRRICAERGVLYFDPSGDFIASIARNNLETLVWNCTTYCHFSSVGHAILGELLYKHLLYTPELAPLAGAEAEK